MTTKWLGFASAVYGMEEWMIDNFQNKTLNYDLEKYPWHEWIRNTIKELYPDVDDLSKMHEIISPEQAHNPRDRDRPRQRDPSLPTLKRNNDRRYVRYSWR